MRFSTTHSTLLIFSKVLHLSNLNLYMNVKDYGRIIQYKLVSAKIMYVKETRGVFRPFLITTPTSHLSIIFYYQMLMYSSIIYILFKKPLLYETGISESKNIFDRYLNVYHWIILILPGTLLFIKD